VQGDDALELVRQMRAPFRLALGEGLMLAVVGVGQVVDAGEQRAEELAVVDDAADRDAAEADAVIAALAPDQPRLLALAGDVPVGEGDLERGVDRFRARIAEEDVVEIARRELGDARGRRVNPCGWPNWKAGAKSSSSACFWIAETIESRLWPALQHHRPGDAVDHGAALRRVVVHVLGPRDHARVLLEGAVRRERQPPGFRSLGNMLAIALPIADMAFAGLSCSPAGVVPTTAWAVARPRSLVLAACDVAAPLSAPDECPAATPAFPP
jgi:hypothetical protein